MPDEFLHVLREHLANPSFTIDDLAKLAWTYDLEMTIDFVDQGEQSDRFEGINRDW